MGLGLRFGIQSASSQVAMQNAARDFDPTDFDATDFA